ncbi:ParB/RepB/Spo0J family partition protein [Dactylosporangium sp. CA-233914]|uniref:ParB/RepB/Spo0J family partition protein n=1 Tax=Dactylosporangium sp. CA-233914 TaxID=3239934 RepID=UPI003D8B9A1B
MSTAVLPAPPLDNSDVDAPPTADLLEIGEPSETAADIEEFEPTENLEQTEDSRAGEEPRGGASVLPKLVAEYLDARELLDDPNNLRKNLRESLGLTPEPLSDDDPDFDELRTLVDGDLEQLPAGVRQLAELKASIEEVGVLQPLVVIPAPGRDGAWQIVIGHRRKYASILVKKFQVPCLLATDYDEAKRIVAQLVENVHRVGLTASEEAEAFEQLTLLAWSTERIAKLRGVPEKTVVHTLKLRNLPAAVTAKVDAGQLTLAEAADLEQLADDPKATERVLMAESGWKFRQALAGELARRAADRAKELAKAQLVVDGVKVTAKPAGFGYTGTAVDARQLVDGDGKRIDPQVARTLPGFAAFVEKVGNTANTVVYCKDPDAYGYRKVERTYGRQLSDEEVAEKLERERVQAEYLAALDVAKGVRREFITTTYGPAKAAKRLFVAALRQAVTGARRIRLGDVDGLYGALGGVGDDVLATAGEDRLRRCLVAKWICGQERNVGLAATDGAWGLDRAAITEWYAQLVADGYPLAEAETTLLESLTQEEDPDDEDEDEDPDAEGIDDVGDGADDEGEGGDGSTADEDEDLADAAGDIALEMTAASSGQPEVPDEAPDLDTMADEGADEDIPADLDGLDEQDGELAGAALVGVG